MHIAADHGFDSIIVYLHKVLNQNLNDLDVDKRAPIHLSAMNGNSNTTILLISLIKDVNIKDIEGNTPLHFAVASQSYITIKHLLIKGGDKSMLNNNNDSPLTMAIRTGGQDIIKLIVRFIKRNKTCMDKLNPFYRDRSNPKNSSKKFVFYILVYTIRSILILNSLSYQDRMAFLCVSVGLIGVNLFLFLFLSCSDPGYKEKSTMSLVELYTQYRTDFICPYCEVKKNQSTRHCFYCSRCVEVKNI
jgi:Ankyrin repeats (3 copies)